ncbi:MAG: thiamine pyrophosphate-dependent enzyme [Acidimicrobiia bacterium]|nr:thiamine pyrophosphate-dependent enzyme [Acidimicrobiia bacterium]
MKTLNAPTGDLLDTYFALQSGDAKHETAATSTLDVLWTLYDRVLRVDPANPSDPARDRFLVSKGHGPQALYAVLAAKGFFPVEWLATFGEFDSPLGHHPDRLLIPGVEISSGSLGHGLPIALGTALALDAQGMDGPRVVCLVGDGELDEGSNHEAIAVAARLGVGRLQAVVVDNSSSRHGWPGGIAARFEVEGWRGVTVDGRDHYAIERAFSLQSPSVPLFVVAEVTR